MLFDTLNDEHSDNNVDNDQEGNTECVAALLAVGANVRAVNARGQVVRLQT